MHDLLRLLRDARGAAAIEYGLIAALIAVASIATMSSLGRRTGNSFTNVANNMRAS